MRMNETTHPDAAQDIAAPISKASSLHYTWRASAMDGAWSTLRD